MADTVEISVANDSWTDVSGSDTNGLLTNFSQYRGRIREATSQPSATSDIGHVLNPQENTYFYLAGNQKLWMKGIENSISIAKTPGLSLNKEGHFTKDFLQEVNIGNIPGHELVHKFGSNSDVGTVEEDIWEQGGILDWLTAAETVDVVSSDTTNDISSGLGARTVEITGLDTNFNKIVEVVTLLATPVTTTNLFRRILTCKVLTVGAYGNTNFGNITMTATTAGTVQALMLATEGRTSQVHYTIEAGKTAYILRVSISVSTGKEVSINFHNRPDAGNITAPFTAHTHNHHWDGLSVPINQRFFANHKFLEKTDLWFDGAVPTTSAGIDVDYDILLVDNLV